MCSIDVPELADLDGLGPRQLAALLAAADGARRRIDAIIAEMVGVAERSVAYAEDGHASVSGWAKATCNWSSAETKTMVQTARLLHAVPEARRAAHDGLLGVAQAQLLAKVFANPRCADQLPASAELLVGHAHSLWFDEFAVVVRRWEALADADGAHQAHERAHCRRDAHVSIVGERVYLEGRGGVPAGVVIEEVFERFCRAEFDHDWETGKASWGERMNPSLLDRSAAQRRFDALLAIFTAAAGSGAIAHIDPLVNIIVDQTTLEHHLARLAGNDPDPIDPSSVDDRRCETSSGHQLDPDDMLAAALTGHVRRVVFDTAGVVIDLGRRARLFTGSSRDAVILGDRWCLWPGCDQRSGRCQTDHSQPWTSNGPTSPNNAGPACARHNRWKHQSGYRTQRDPTGHWHTYRPDGTEIGPLTNPTNHPTQTRQHHYSSG
jgi:PAS domain-containing protein